MKKAGLFAVTLLSTSIAANAAVVITSQDISGVTVSTFHKGVLLTTDGDGNLITIIDSKNNSCEFFMDGYRIVENCDQIPSIIEENQRMMTAGMQKRDREMFAQMTKMQAAQTAPTVTKEKSRVVANHKSYCYAIYGSPKQIACFSKDLANKIKEEFDLKFMEKLEGGFNLNGPGMDKDPAQKTLNNLAKDAYPVLNMKQSAPGVRGFNSTMLNYLPKEQRDKIMREMGAGSGGKMEKTSEVTNVKNVSDFKMPDRSHFETKSLQEYMADQMGRMGGSGRR